MLDTYLIGLFESGLNDEWWAHAGRCFCFYRNVVDILAPEYGRPEETAFKRRFGYDFRGPLINFGAEILYKPISEADKSRTHQMSAKLLRVFLWVMWNVVVVLGPEMY